MLVFVGLPNAHSKLVYLRPVRGVSAVEGIILVATPALIRDFSPQLGRASAMGFWTLGPVVGSLVVTEVSSHTLDTATDWQYQFRYCRRSPALAVFVIAFFGLRELSPRLRDQLMVSLRDRALIEAKARGVDPDAGPQGAAGARCCGSTSSARRSRSALFLLFYYIAVGLFVVYFATNFGYTLSRANAPRQLVLERERARADRHRPALGLAEGAQAVHGLRRPRRRRRRRRCSRSRAHRRRRPATTLFALILVSSRSAAAIAYATWMAAFTETVEKHNPAATATGLAVWGGVLRTVVAIVLTVLALTQTATSILVDKGPATQAILAKYPQQIATAQLIDPATSAALTKNPNDTAAGLKAAGEVQKGAGVDLTEAIKRLLALKAVPKADLAYIQTNGPKVLKAQHDSPNQWRTWWWLCFAGQILFLPFIFLMAGRWSPRKARDDLAEHEERVQQELAALGPQEG